VFVAGMQTRAVLAAVVTLGAVLAAPVAAGERTEVARAVAAKLHAAKHGIRPQTHATDFATDHIGCITLTRGEMRGLGYGGHAFACEESSAAEVLGALLDRAGRVRCEISGFYVGDGCYDLAICDVLETLCLE
jgi:hypothetical protein